MGCTTSAEQDMQDLYPTREQFDALIPHVGFIRLEAGSQQFMLRRISETNSYVLAAVTVSRARMMRGADIFKQDDLLILKIRGKVRVLPEQSSCWYKLLNDMLGESDDVSLFLGDLPVKNEGVTALFMAAQGAIGAASLLAFSAPFKACANAYFHRNGRGVTFDEASGVYHYIGPIGDTPIVEALIGDGCFLGAEDRSPLE
jgi:hypothetical protein